MNTFYAALFRACLCLMVLAAPSTLAAHDIKQVENIVWASPAGFDLTLDIAVPQTDTPAKPVLIIFHGGGWLLNNQSIMTDLANSIASRSEVITVNVNYRLLVDVDNTTTPSQMVEDAMGAVLWVKDHIHSYGGDPDKVAVTGDSAGGHLATMVTLAGRQLSSSGFAEEPLGFNPTYRPEGMTAEQIAQQDGLKLQAVILSYPAFSLYEAARNGFEQADNPFWQWAGGEARGMFGKHISVENQPHYYKAVSADPYMINAKDYALPPQFVLVGEQDNLTTPTSIRQYVEQLHALDQPAQMKVYADRGHGFLDSGCNDYNNGCFAELSEPTVNDMISFLNEVFDL